MQADVSNGSPKTASSTAETALAPTDRSRVLHASGGGKEALELPIVWTASVVSDVRPYSPTASTVGWSESLLGLNNSLTWYHNVRAGEALKKCSEIFGGPVEAVCPQIG